MGIAAASTSRCVRFETVLKKPRCSPPSAAPDTIFEGLVFTPVHHQSGPTDRRATSRRVRRRVQDPKQSQREPELLPLFVCLEIGRKAGQWNKVESYAKSVEKFCETKGEGRKEEAVEELKEEEKGESKSNAARKKNFQPAPRLKGSVYVLRRQCLR